MVNNYICDFEIYGKVQGVFFRKYTCSTAKKFGLGGWCMNTENNTVKGQLEGPIGKIQQMQVWLSNHGSPKSKIEKAMFTQLNEVPEKQFNTFSIRK